MTERLIRNWLDHRFIEAASKVRLIAFDFDGVFTDNAVYVDQNGIESVRCWRSDGLGLRKLEEIGIKPIILSTEANPVVMKRSEKLHIDCIHGSLDKHKDLSLLLDKLQLKFTETAFVGNDINDLECLKAVVCPIIVHDAHPDVTEYAVYKTKTPGGYGAVREVCDLFSELTRINS